MNTDKVIWEVIPPDVGSKVHIGAHHGDVSDEWLLLTGDFESLERKIARAQEICDQLNGGRINAAELMTTKVSLTRKIEEYIARFSGGDQMKSMNESFCDDRIVNVLKALKLEIQGKKS